MPGASKSVGDKNTWSLDMNCCIQFTPSPRELWTWLVTSGDIREHLKPLLSEFKFPFIVSSCPVHSHVYEWRIEKRSSKFQAEASRWDWSNCAHLGNRSTNCHQIYSWEGKLAQIFYRPNSSVIVEASKLIHFNISQR